VLEDAECCRLDRMACIDGRPFEAGGIVGFSDEKL
jgi:hypothetical protein